MCNVRYDHILNIILYWLLSQTHGVKTIAYFVNHTRQWDMKKREKLYQTFPFSSSILISERVRKCVSHNFTFLDSHCGGGGLSDPQNGENECRFSLVFSPVLLPLLCRLATHIIGQPCQNPPEPARPANHSLVKLARNCWGRPILAHLPL